MKHLRRPHLRAAFLGSLVLAALIPGTMGCGGPGDAAEPQTDPSTLRETPLGKVIGFSGEDGAHTWRGIPFAKPPVGELRWRAPLPPERWAGTLEALAHGEPCPQFAGPGGVEDAAAGEPTGSEDCLTLNVFAPPFEPGAVPTGDRRLPVMLWIHGGGNSVGSAKVYDGGLLAVKHDVIVVAVHYRMGVLGWFTHPALRLPGASLEDVSGNYGTLDLVRSLEWVQRNVAAFGGDADRVLVFGESAGGTDTFSMLLSPLASGLFHRAIVQSGGAGTTERAEAENFTDDPEPGDENSSNEVLTRLLVRDGRAPDREAAKQVAGAMAPAEIAAYLRGKSAEELLTLYEGSGMGGMYRSPDLFRDGHVLPAIDPLVAFDKGQYNRVPTILGTNRDESRLFMLFGSDYVTKALGLPLWLNDEPRYLAGTQYSTQMWKVRGVDDPAQRMAGAQGPSVYAYRFDWDDEAGFLWLDLSTMLGAAHAFEIPFVFGWLTMGRATSAIFDEANAEADRQLSDAMMSYWTNFAYTGTPGRGRGGQLPEWSAWATEEEASKLILLDAATDGGIRMSNRRIDKPGIVAAIAQDPRLPSARDRCEVYYSLARFGSAFGEDEYAELCPDHPFDGYPWRG